MIKSRVQIKQAAEGMWKGGSQGRASAGQLRSTDANKGFFHFAILCSSASPSQSRRHV